MGSYREVWLGASVAGACAYDTHGRVYSGGWTNNFVHQHCRARKVRVGAEIESIKEVQPATHFW